MKIKTTIAAVLLASLPSLTFAMGCGFGEHATQTNICAVGQIWDTTTATCIDAVTS